MFKDLGILRDEHSISTINGLYLHSKRENIPNQ